MSPRESALVKAAGGVLWRMTADGVEVLVAHRQRYDDWSFPKGKLDPVDDGDDTRCALREVLEETGYRCTIGRELPTVGYTDAKGRPKRVRYWEMTVVDGEFAANDEVDEVRWVSPGDARHLLSYARDEDVLDSFLVFAGVRSA